MLNITNNNIRGYVVENGLECLYHSMSQGLHVLALTKKDKIIGKGFTDMLRSEDKCAIKSIHDIRIIPKKDCKVNKILCLTADGNFSLEYDIVQYFHSDKRKTLICAIMNKYLPADSVTILNELNLRLSNEC